MNILVEKHHELHNSLNTLETGTFEPKAQIPGFVYGTLSVDDAGEVDVVCRSNGAYFTIYSVNGEFLDRETVWENYGTYLKVRTIKIGNQVYSDSFREVQTGLEKDALEVLAAISGTHVFECSVNNNVYTRLQDAYSECQTLANESVLDEILTRHKKQILSAKENLDRLQKLAAKLGVKLGQELQK